MKCQLIHIVVISLGLFVFDAPGSVFYVNVSNTVPLTPFSTWSTAATNIQDAIDAANPGDTVLVTNGVYSNGGRVMLAITNRVALNKPISLQSVNGPLVTIIQGAGMTNGASGVRCAWLTNGASMTGFTLQYGATGTASDNNGGGVWCMSIQPVIANCIITSNSANGLGGGVYNGNLINCALYANVANTGGGAASSVMNNCTVTKNWATSIAGGTSSGYFTNCIVYNNSSAFYSAPGNPGTNYQFGSWSYSCAIPLPPGTGNISAAPQVFVDNIHLTAASPCRGAGTNPVLPADIYGLSWSNPPSMGCAEWEPAPSAGQLNVQINDNGRLTVNVPVAGQSPFVCGWTTNGTPVEDGSDFNSVNATSLVVNNPNLLVGILYQAIVTNAIGVATSSPVLFPVHCVNASGTNPVSPYLTWATAATNIQDAITASAAGDVVLVTNGVYGSGGISMDGVITNRVSVNKPILVQSVNGSGVTSIQGAWDSTSTNGPGAVRCAWLTNNATLNGFTLQGGATRILNSFVDGSGGGVWGTSTNATVFNCVISTNFSFYQAGGAYQVTLNNCTLTGNQAYGSGIAGNGIAGAGSGGGAVSSILKNCLITSNFADQSAGGGTLSCNATNCAYLNNVSGLEGSGASYGTLVNCTVANNVSKISYNGSGGAVANATLINCIVYGNFKATPSSQALTGQANYFSTQPCIFSYSDTDPLPSGIGNIDVNPQLLADDIHLATNSPCIGAGTSNVVSATDIDGQPWNNPPSIGCDEWQPAPIITAQLGFQVSPANRLLNFSTQIAGQSPFICQWSQNGVPIQNGIHYMGSTTPNLVVSNFSLTDAGVYQVVISNSFGVVTSKVSQVVMHGVAAAGTNPIAPYSTWTTAATNIQDAVDSALPGDIVLVTNGVYAYGGRLYNGVYTGVITNRVLVTQPQLTILSVNGFASTVIEGAWDPNTTNGPLAARCCLVAANNVSLSGFTLQGGATCGSAGMTQSLWSNDNLGGGVSSVGQPFPFNTLSFSGVEVNNCLITSNTAGSGDGGGASYVNLNNCIVTGNIATEGGGTYNCQLTNCTVSGNHSSSIGGGTSNGNLYNCISFNNTSVLVGTQNSWNPRVILFSCTTPAATGTGNIIADPEFVDSTFHLSATSPCRGVGSSLYSSGLDIDGENWNNPPSMGADEVYTVDFAGPLSVAIQTPQINSFVGRSWNFTGQVTGRAAGLGWDWGDGSTATNVSYLTSHIWTNTGNYTVTFTAYNNDNPAGVSTHIAINVLPLNVPQLLPSPPLTNGFQFQFIGQTNANYTIQYATNLMPPAVWQTLQTILSSTGGVIQINDSNWTNAARFYRVLAQ
jgi:immunoglobulin I-set domain protein/PKD domain-containing protein